MCYEELNQYCIVEPASLLENTKVSDTIALHKTILAKANDDTAVVVFM